MDEIINFDLPANNHSIIKVLGIGGGGGNAVNHMHSLGIKDVDFIVCNTDAQALANSHVPVKIQLGESLTEGRGAGNKPEIGRQAAIENLNDVIEVLSNHTKMVFITAGMGGGTGTGAAPVIAKAAKELGILTVAILTIPFRNEGQRRINQALEGIAEIESHVDSLLVINNEKIRSIYGDLKVSEAFSKADDILAIAAKGIAEIITVHGYINVDFADVETVMTNSGVAIMGSAKAEGEDRAIKAVQDALRSPLLNDNDIKGAKNILINITSGAEEVTMDEIGQITDYIQECAGTEADLIWGNGVDEKLGNQLSVTIIATGFGTNSIPDLYVRKRQLDKVSLNDNVTGASPEKEQNFRITDKQPDEEVPDNPAQRIIEFDIKNDRAEQQILESSKLKSQVDVTKAAERVRNIRKTHERLKELRFSNPENNNYIEALENEPAYVRKNVPIKKNKPSEESDISKYSLTDEESGSKLSKNNPYLHDKVD
ncbi:MAG TPA: cell division protein FtsZ [Bacteroidales bacterium]|nr:cell division protein FtsZ [Bacteroidales bacterium]